jgi:hypothetical protein
MEEDALTPQKTRTHRKLTQPSYNRFLAISARAIRRSLKEDKRIAAERRGEMELRFSRWEVSDSDPRVIAKRPWTVTRKIEELTTADRTASRASPRISARPTLLPWLSRPPTKRRIETSDRAYTGERGTGMEDELAVACTYSATVP